MDWNSWSTRIELISPQPGKRLRDHTSDALNPRTLGRWNAFARRIDEAVGTPCQLRALFQRHASHEALNSITK